MLLCKVLYFYAYYYLLQLKKRAYNLLRDKRQTLGHDFGRVTDFYFYRKNQFL